MHSGKWMLDQKQTIKAMREREQRKQDLITLGLTIAVIVTLALMR